jgi:Predicted AAA-ATPase
MLCENQSEPDRSNTIRDGISPLSTTDVISSKPQFHGLCGLTDGEVDTILKAYLLSTYNESQLKEAMVRMKEWYNGYWFCPDHISTSLKLPSLYNLQLVFSHLQALAQGTQSEALLEETNLTHCATVLDAIQCDGPINLNDIFFDVLSGQLVADVMPYFGVDNMKEIGADPVITWMILYYFRVFTHGPGCTLQLPNATMRYLVCVTLS